MKKEKMVDWLAEGSISVPKLFLQHYKGLGLNEEEFMLLLHVYCSIESGNSFPTPKQLAERMTCSEMRCMELLKYLIQRGFLQLEEKSEHGVLTESYSLRPLWERLLLFLNEIEAKQMKAAKENEEIDLYSLFEQEFGRPLSPMECESLTIWIDQDGYSSLLIRAALREAVMSEKVNLRYIDRILFEWQKKGIETVEQAREQGMKFRNHQRPKTQPLKQESVSVPFYNWLES